MLSPRSTQCTLLHRSPVSIFSFLNIANILAKKYDYRTVQRSALCRSRRELSNAYFLAKFGLDTAENEPCQVCPTPRNAAAGRTSRGAEVRADLARLGHRSHVAPLLMEASSDHRLSQRRKHFPREHIFRCDR